MEQNPIQRWLANVQKECVSPGELRELAKNVKDKNTRTLLERRATEWGTKELIKKHDKHWSAS